MSIKQQNRSNSKIKSNSCFYFSEVLSSKFLNEQLNLIGKVGCAMCLVGSTVVVLHSPKEQEVERIEDLLEKIKDPGIYMYMYLY